MLFAHLSSAPIICPDPTVPAHQELIDGLAIAIGQDRATKAVCDTFQAINDQAGKGAQRSLLPFLIPVAAISLLAVGLSISAIVRTRKR